MLITTRIVKMMDETTNATWPLDMIPTTVNKMIINTKMDLSSEHKRFTAWKLNTTKKQDLSKKGSIDKPVRNLCKLINDEDSFYTTSSCSGRIIVVSVPQENASTKQNLEWLLNAHEATTAENVLTCLSKASQSFKLKFEPFILHVKCRSVEDAQVLQKAAFSSGFKNSGITFGHQGKHIMCAVRAPSSLEVPLTGVDGTKLVSDEYIQYIISLANEKLVTNLNRIERFEQDLKQCLAASKSKSSSRKRFQGGGKSKMIVASRNVIDSDKGFLTSQKLVETTVSSLESQEVLIKKVEQEFDECMDYCDVLFS